LICDERCRPRRLRKAQTLNLIEDIKAAYALTVVFIAHDLSVVARSATTSW